MTHHLEKYEDLRWRSQNMPRKFDLAYREG